jgi:hypothetical protein
MLVRSLHLVLIAVFIQSCSTHTIPTSHINDGPGITREHVLAVFMDGTKNEVQVRKPHTNTHLQRIHHLAYTNYRSLYIDGVGSNKNPLELIWGANTRKRVAIAYCFLNKYYSSGDTIALFGFSRGANQCRILSNLIYTFGFLKFDTAISEKTKHRIIKKCYTKYLIYGDVAKRKKQVASFITKWNNKHPAQTINYDPESKEKIKLMGLWDTVEAFDVDGDGENTCPSDRHLNQIENVEQIFHAVSLDDNRSDVYTPILMNDKRTKNNSNNKLEEVWFSGNHRDVGGGPSKNGNLSTVSLDWMLRKTEDFKLFRDSAFKVHRLAKVNNSSEYPMWLLLGGNRNLHNYYYTVADPAKGKIKIHSSVIERLEKGYAPRFKTWFIRKDWYERNPFKDCFTIENDKITFNEKNCSCIEVVD